MHQSHPALSKRERIARIAVVCVFALMLIMGLLTYRDYSFSIDEGWERRTSIINYQFILDKLTGHELIVEYQSLEDYPQRYYGVFFQLPMVAVEHLTHFSMPLHDVFLMRHLWNHLICFSGWVCFYFFLKKVFASRWLALLGTLMLALYPRFWGGQFNNVKDLVFVATICHTMLCVAWCLECDKRGGSWRADVVTAVVAAVCVNTRVIGLMLPELLFGYRILRDVWLAPVAKTGGAKQLWRNIIRYAVQLLLMLAVLMLITPIAWVEGLAFLPNAIAHFAHYVEWQGTVPFLGVMVRGSEAPWYYIPVWLGISLPLWYLALGLASMPVMAVKAVRSKEGFVRSLFGGQRFYLFALVIAAAPVIAPIFKQVTLYNGWRHMYFILPAAVTTMLFTFHALWQALGQRAIWRRVLAGAACLLLLGQAAWIVRWHPLETVYFNPVGKLVADGMDRDSWYESLYEQMQYVLAHDDASVVNISCYNGAGELYNHYLTPQEQARVEMVTVGAYNEDYLIDTLDTIEPEPFGDFTKIRTVSVDGVEVSHLFIRTEYLNERFGGVWPDSDPA